MTYIPDIDMNRPCLGLESAFSFDFLHMRYWVGIGTCLGLESAFPMDTGLELAIQA